MCVHEPCRKEIERLEVERDALQEAVSEKDAVITVLTGELIKKRMDKQSCRMDNLEEKMSDVIKRSQAYIKHMSLHHSDKCDLEE